jgi:peptidoglycan hydrolase CwlO-like protein
LNDADLHGVELAAIKGLDEKLETENADLKSQLAELKSLVAQLAQARQK